MKKLFFLAVMATGVSLLASCSKSGEDNLTPALNHSAVVGGDKLPAQAQKFVADHFSGYRASEIKINDKEADNGVLYSVIFQRDALRSTVVLPSRVKIEFDKAGQWIEIESLIDGVALPASILRLLPAATLQYVERHYPGTGIHEVERKSYGYKVELVNDKELLFDRSGQTLSDANKGKAPDNGGAQASGNIDQFVQAHFPGYLVAYVKQDREDGVDCRKVYIRKSYWQSFKLVFDMQDNWMEVEGDDYGRTPVPASVLDLMPKGVRDALSQKYPAALVTSVENRSSGYKVELAGDIELYFGKDGSLHGIDDDSKSIDNNPINPDQQGGNTGSDYEQGKGQLPAAAKQFLAQHYPNVYIKKIERKPIADEDGKVFEVELVGGVEIDFDASGEWIEVDGDERALPVSVVALLPETVKQDLKRRFDRATIVTIKKKATGYGVELLHRGDDVEVYYDARGNFLGIDN